MHSATRSNNFLVELQRQQSLSIEGRFIPLAACTKAHVSLRFHMLQRYTHVLCSALICVLVMYYLLLSKAYTLRNNCRRNRRKADELAVASGETGI
jgi:hypothetical protein